ncbi:hypothetical protein BST61_g7732 [Cercospora zeina]
MSASAYQYLEQLEGEQMTVLVGTGSEIKSFTARRKLLSARSRWMESALKNSREGQERLIKLPEDRPGAFAQWLTWIYRGQCELWIWDSEEGNDPTERGPRLQDMLQSWNFGDKYVLPDFQNSIIAVIASILNDDHWVGRLSIQEQADALAATRSDTPARMLVADYVVQQIHETDDWSIQNGLADCEGALESLFASEEYSNSRVLEKAGFHEAGSR